MRQPEHRHGGPEDKVHPLSLCQQEAQKDHQGQQAEAQKGGYGGEAIAVRKI